MSVILHEATEVRHVRRVVSVHACLVLARIARAREELLPEGRQLWVMDDPEGRYQAGDIIDRRNQESP